MNMANNDSKVTTAEFWRDIKGFEGKYQVSSLGHVRSLDRVIKMKNGRERHITGHAIRPFNNGLGYQQVVLTDNGKQTAHLVHRLVLDTFMPISKDEALVLTDIDHVSSNPADNSLSNLRRCTHAQNLRKEHRMNQIRHACIAVNGQGEIVLKAKSMTAMAELLGVSQSAISAHVSSGKPISSGLTIIRDNNTDKQANKVKEVA